MRSLGKDSAEAADKYMERFIKRDAELFGAIRRKFRECFVKGWYAGYEKAMEEKDDNS